MRHMKKAVLAVLSASMILGTASVVSAEESTGAFSLESIMNIASEVWNEVSEEDKAEIMEGVDAFFADEEIQGYVGELMENIPEEYLPAVLNTLLQFTGAGDALGEGLELTDEEMQKIPTESTHDEILEKTGIDFKEADDGSINYSLATLGENIYLANCIRMSDSAFECAFAVTGIGDIEQAKEYYDDLNSETLTETTYDGKTAYYVCDEDISNSCLAWIDEEDGNLYGVTSFLLEDGIVDEAALMAIADEFYK